MLNNILNLEGVAVLGKKQQMSVNGAGRGFITCEDGTTWEAPAQSIDSVIRGGTRWCRDHGHGGLSSHLYVGELNDSIQG